MATLILDSDEEDVVIIAERFLPPAKASKAKRKRRKEKRKERKRLKKKEHSERQTQASQTRATARSTPKAASQEVHIVPAVASRKKRPAAVDCCYRVRSAGDYPATLCAECRRPLDSLGPDVAVVEVERPWLQEACLVHAQMPCLTAAGLLRAPMQPPRPEATSSASHGVLRSLPAPPRRVAPRLRCAVADPDARSLAQARQMATAAALRLVRRAASDAADAASGRRPARRTTAPGSQLLEAVLEVLPPARHAHREEVPKGEHCAICHGKLFKRTRKIRSLPCGHTFHDACILPWLSKRATCPLDRSDFTDLLKQNQGIAGRPSGSMKIPQLDGGLLKGNQQYKRDKQESTRNRWDRTSDCQTLG
ncbi:unnamed protein product [Cladocopium goreaui]|uniref:E3 ubiquitin-protein ligase n=1 Tax=Cladocopium goreaui TaxID=2562237 RepID=A0A9P1BT88_9DINO|nr:unnamed protein product [Cladocopium goreaui]